MKKKHIIGFGVGGLSGIIPGIIGMSAVMITGLLTLYKDEGGAGDLVMLIPFFAPPIGFVGGAIGGTVFCDYKLGSVGGALGGLALASVLTTIVFIAPKITETKQNALE